MVVTLLVLGVVGLGVLVTYLVTRPPRRDPYRSGRSYSRGAHLPPSSSSSSSSTDTYSPPIYVDFGGYSGGDRGSSSHGDCGDGGSSSSGDCGGGGDGGGGGGGD